MEPIVRAEMLDRVMQEIQDAQHDRRIITDDWFPFDADWEINIWTENGLTKARAYPNEKTGTGSPVDLFENRLTWPVRVDDQTYWLKTKHDGETQIWALCERPDGVDQLVNIAWCLGINPKELLLEMAP